MGTRDLLDGAGLNVPDEEIDRIIAWIEGSRAMAQVLWSAGSLPRPPTPGRVDWNGSSDD